MTIQLLYPSSPISPTKPDEMFEQEYLAAINAGIHCVIFSDEDWQNKKLKVNCPFQNTPIIYRGWMLSPESYESLFVAAANNNGQFLNTTERYLNGHHLPNWYEQAKEYTPETILISPPYNESNIKQQLKGIKWDGYFVKDFVKSLTTERGSIAHSMYEITEIIDLLLHYRGNIEGGICIRQLETFQEESEERYFIYQHQAYARDNLPVPEMVKILASKIDSDFFSADVVFNAQNQPRLIELGDGQVSDLKKWNAQQFMQIFQ